MTSQTPITRIRVRYAKGESLRFTGHLDMQRLWERTLRRSQLPIRYSQGYHPRARLNLASALPLGFVSNEELLDFWMDEPQPLKDIQSRLTTSAPIGLRIISVRPIELGEDSLQVRIKASEFTVTFYDPQNKQDLESRVTALLERDQISRSRRKKTYDLRPLILEMAVIDTPSGDPGLSMRLLAEPGATGRPDDLLDELGYPNTAYLVNRTRIFLN